MKFSSNVQEYDNDLQEVVRLFYDKYEESEDEIKVNASIFEQNYLINLDIVANGVTKNYTQKYPIIKTENELYMKRYYKRAIKKAIYVELSENFNVTLPWGCLTGVRPTKLAHELLLEGKTPLAIKGIFQKEYLVTEKKAKLVCDIIKNQKNIIRNDKLVNLYINIPFCPTRCAYCSFISSEIGRCIKQIPDYLSSLMKEIRATKDLIKEKSLIVTSIYIGGGTPTSLSAEELDMLLNEIGYNVNEFTVECGRPDTITKEKLDVLQKYNVTRISINPQTFSDRTLKLIGRGHNTSQTMMAYSLAMNYNFDINMDLIAGLPKESLRTFKKNIDTVLMLAPTNITVHTLAIKHGSILAQHYVNVENNDIKKMLDYADLKLSDAGYIPYYMYRLKNMLGSFENVGYCEKGKACRFNIDSMEETGSIIAVGAGGISKRIFWAEERIERSANVKDIKEYITRIDEMIERKNTLFE